MTKVLTILVHGTWGRGTFQNRIYQLDGKRWFEPCSHFCVSLVAAAARVGIECELLGHEWSGRNSIKDRDAGARSLAHLIERHFDPSRHESILVVGHSHGGTVAVNCLKYLQARMPIKLVTLATPFLSIRPIITAIPYWLLPYLFAAAFAYGILHLAIYFTVSVLPLYFVLKTDLQQVSITFALYAISLVSGLVAIRIVRRLLGVLIDESISNAAVEPNARAHWLAELVNLSALLRKDVPLLALRGVADEAALTLAAGTIATRLTQLAMVLFSQSMGYALKRTWRVVIALIILSGIAVWVHDTAYPRAAIERLSYYNSFVGQNQVWSLGILLTFITSAILLFVYLPRIFMATFGTELLWGAGDCEASAESVPDWENVTVHTISSGDPSFNLRHKLYDQLSAPITIGAWLAPHDGRTLDERRDAVGGHRWPTASPLVSGLTS